MDAISLYLHIPFCKHRCGYCDFNTYAGLENLISPYMMALNKELVSVSQGVDERISLHTIFFGGGTPSLVPIAELEKIFSSIAKEFQLEKGVEITLEVNPGTVDLAYMEGLRNLGVNRLSIGVQSATQSDLVVLEREHGHDDAVTAVELARKAGFENISLDLIFGVPNQTMKVWQKNLTLAIDLDPEHLSLYALTVEHGTPLEKLVANGSVPLPNPDLAADMYEWAEEYLSAKGFVHYEISNWARNDQKGNPLISKHNLQYWLNDPYIGIGAGAHGFINHHRTMNVLSPASYIERHKEISQRDFPRTPATVTAKLLDQDEEIKETMMMGLRLLNIGVSRTRFKLRFNRDLEKVYEEEISDLIIKGLLEWGGEDNDNLILSQKGRLLGNQVFMRFI